MLHLHSVRVIIFSNMTLCKLIQQLLILVFVTGIQFSNIGYARKLYPSLKTSMSSLYSNES